MTLSRADAAILRCIRCYGHFDALAAARLAFDDTGTKQRDLARDILASLLALGLVARVHRGGALVHTLTPQGAAMLADADGGPR